MDLGSSSKSSSRRPRPRPRRRASLSVGVHGGGRGVDLTSGLSDDLLVRILGLMDARDVVLSSDLISRRWRGLWLGVSALRFFSDRWRAVGRKAGAAERYLGFVDGVLALRAEATAAGRYAAVEDLEISLDISNHKTRNLVPPSFKAARRWVRFALEHGLKSLALHLELPWHRLRARFRSGEDPAMDLDGLASPTKLETMHFTLGGARLCLLSSTVVVFTSLTDVSLKEIKVAGHVMTDLVSSRCCPRLRRLHLTDLRLVSTVEEEGLLLESNTLSELSLRMVLNISALKLETPSLQALHVENCLYPENFTVVSAPRLEDITVVLHQPLDIVDDNNHLLSVETLKINLYSHGNLDGDDNNDGCIRLLECCSLTRCLAVSIEVLAKVYQTNGIIKGRIPSLPHVTSLTVRVTMPEPHSFGPSIESFLAQCNNIRYLNLEFCYMIKNYMNYGNPYLCDLDSCQWKYHEFSLPHLQEAKFKWLLGTDCELHFIQSILKGATGVQNIAIDIGRNYWRKDNKDAFELMPPLDGGSWTRCNNVGLSYKWSRHCA